MWAPINTVSILQNAKVEIWEKCCTALLETLSVTPCDMGRHFQAKEVVSTQVSCQKDKSFLYMENSNTSCF